MRKAVFGARGPQRLHGLVLGLTLAGATGCAEGVVPEKRKPFPFSVDSVTESDAASDAAPSPPWGEDGSSGEIDTGLGEQNTVDAAAAQSDASDPVSADASTGDAGQVGGGSPDASLDCGQGTTECAGACVDLDTSLAHCGACGDPCQGSCQEGKCTPSGCQAASLAEHDYLFCNSATGWLDARKRCLGWGLDLVSIGDQSENDFVKAGPGAASVQWVGLSDRDKEGSWRFPVVGTAGNTNGVAASFFVWFKDEPNNSQSCSLGIFCDAGEDCATIKADGTWNDDNCEDDYAFVCESY